MNLMEVSEAAERLGVSTRQVQNLVASGDLRQHARGVIDQTSVERLLSVRGTSHRRAWSEPTAWGAVSLLSGGDAAWMGTTQRSRLRARLRGLKPAELVERARGRAVVTRYAGHASSVVRLRDEVIGTSRHSAALGLADATSVDGYLSAEQLNGVVGRHGLVRDDEGRFTLRATTMGLDVVAELAERTLVLAALDLAESLDVRERRAGVDALERALGEING